MYIYFVCIDIVSATDTSVSVPEMDFTIDASFSGLHVEVVNKRRPVTALDVRGMYAVCSLANVLLIRVCVCVYLTTCFLSFQV